MDGGFEDGSQRAPWTSHDAIYGIFAEGESDSDDYDGSRRRKRCRGGSEPDLSKLVPFVPAGNVMPSRRPESPDLASASAAGANEEEEGIEPLPTLMSKEKERERVGTACRRQASGPPGSLGANNTVAKNMAGCGYTPGMGLGKYEQGIVTPLEIKMRPKYERDRVAATRRAQASGSAGQQEPALGSVRANTTVANIMGGMGYTDGMGLGKHGQGNTEPVEITMRPKYAGLGSVEGFEKHKPMSAKENLPPRTSPPPAWTMEQQPRWSKKASARKAPVLTKREMLARRAEQEQEQQPAVVQKLIDMRGPQPRVLTTLQGLNDEQEMEADDAPMPELQCNARLLVDEAETDVVRLDGHLRREQEKVASLVREKENLSKHEALQRRQLQVMETIAGALEQVVDDAAGVLNPDGLLQTLQDLKVQFREEFKMCGIAWIACQFAHSLLLRAFQGWQPLQDPSFGLEVMSSWKDLLEGDLSYDFSHGAASMAPYAQLVSEVIQPVMRTAGTNSWEARDPEPMLQLLVSWKQLLPPTVLRSVLEHVVMPKLSAAVDSWDPRREKVPIHVWVHPWLDMLEQRSIETLCHSIRYKLSSALQVCQVHDESAHTLLSPWKNVFDPAIWEDLIVRCIVPKLKMALQEFQINPADQKLEPFSWVMVWASEVPMHLMVRMLQVDFFSKWQHVLCRWLRSPNPDFNEIFNWYKGWKGLFPQELLANERIRTHLAVGLEMMNKAIEGLEVVQPGAREIPGCLSASEKRRQLDAASLPCYSAEPGAGMADLSFKECIQACATDKGLLFMPRVGKFNNGMPVYEFGTASICIDSVKRVVYAQLQNESERWTAVSLKQLMEMNLMGRTC